MTEQINIQATDRTGWPSGPWDGEPDRVEWYVDDVPCLITRNPNLGHLCGYVAVPPGHPWHGKGYDDIDVGVHGGLTYADLCAPDIGVCHVPRPGEPEDVWWVGFDLAHYGDLSPVMVMFERKVGFGPFPGEWYKDVSYVTRQCEDLARQAQAQ